MPYRYIRVCMYIRMYVYLCLFVSMYVWVIRLNTFMHVCRKYVWIHACAHACMHVCMCACIYACVCVVSIKRVTLNAHKCERGHKSAQSQYRYGAWLPAYIKFLIVWEQEQASDAALPWVALVLRRFANEKQRLRVVCARSPSDYNWPHVRHSWRAFLAAYEVRMHVWSIVLTGKLRFWGENGVSGWSFSRRRRIAHCRNDT